MITTLSPAFIPARSIPWMAQDIGSMKHPQSKGMLEGRLYSWDSGTTEHPAKPPSVWTPRAAKFSQKWGRPS